MRTEEEIREELAKVEERLRYMPYDDIMWDKLNSRKWTLKWVLKDEECN